MGTLRPDARKVIANAAATPHGFGGLVQCGIDTNLSIVVRDAVSYRLHKAIDQGRLQLGAGRGIDATAEDQTTHLRAIEGFLPYRALLRQFDRRERARHTATYVVDGELATLGIFFEKNL